MRRAYRVMILAFLALDVAIGGYVLYLIGSKIFGGVG